MEITIFSFITSVLWFNVFIIVITLMRKRNSFIMNFSVVPLLLLAAICFSRLLLFFELPNTIVIESEQIFPAIIKFLTVSRFSLLGDMVGISLLDMFVASWIVGSLYYIQLYTRQSIQLRKILRSSKQSHDVQILQSMSEIIKESGKSTKVRVIQASWITVPMVTGFFRPTIILPDISFTDAERKSILLHEWTHFLHKDAWVKLSMCLLCALFWWNPFVHILKSGLNHIQEIRCDLKLTAKMSEYDRLQYLESIAKVIKFKLVLKNIPEYTELPAVSMLVSTNNVTKIEQRFTLVLDNTVKRKCTPTTILLYTSILLAFLCSYMFVLQPACYSPADAGYEETFTISLENSYLKANGDGTYALYEYNQYIFDVTDISSEPISSLPVMQ